MKFISILISVMLYDTCLFLFLSSPPLPSSSFLFENLVNFSLHLLFFFFSGISQQILVASIVGSSLAVNEFGWWCMYIYLMSPFPGK